MVMYNRIMRHKLHYLRMMIDENKNLEYLASKRLVSGLYYPAFGIRIKNDGQKFPKYMSLI